MNTKTFYALILNLILFSSYTQAQLKELNFKEVFGNQPKDLLNPMPFYRGWADDSHYIEYRQSKPYTVDVRSGEAIPSAPAQVNEASVFVSLLNIQINGSVAFKNQNGRMIFGIFLFVTR